MRWFTALLCLMAAWSVVSCGGGGASGSGPAEPGVYLIDQGNDRLVWLTDVGASYQYMSFGPAVTGISYVINGTVDSTGRIYLIDGNNSSVVRFDNLVGDGRTEFGSHGTGTGHFLNPVRVSTDRSGRIYVVDRDQNLLIRFDKNGGNWTSLDLSTWFVGADEPDLTVDGAGNIYMAGGSTVVKLAGMTSTGAVTFGSPGSGNGQFAFLTGIALDDSNRIFLADGGNDRIAKIDNMTGSNWVAFGTTGGGLNQFNIPFGIGVDHDGRVYVGDRNNQRLVRIDNMIGDNWAEMDGVTDHLFSFPLSVFPHLPAF